MELTQGDPVVVFAPAFYREKRLGIVLAQCKDHEHGIRIRLLDPSAPIKEVCADVTNGDTIERLSNENPA